MPYSRASCLSQLIVCALEAADKARVKRQALPGRVVLNPESLGYDPADEITVTSAEEPYLPDILEWAKAATAATGQTLTQAGVLLRGPKNFVGQGASSGSGVRREPGPPGGGVQTVAELQTETLKNGSQAFC